MASGTIRLESVLNFRDVGKTVNEILGQRYGHHPVLDVSFTRL
jgi:hypothetical protein